MIPPAGFKQEMYPLRHRIVNAFGLSAVTVTMNSAYIMLVHSTTDIDKDVAIIEVNPHNTAYVTETGPAVQKMSILDRLSLSLKFNLTARAKTDNVDHIRLTWRPIFFSFPEKLDAADDDTGTTVATILGLTKDATNQDVVPLTTTKLMTDGASNLTTAVSTVNQATVFGDLNMTTDLAPEDHPWNETLFQDAVRRYTNKGALKACVGRTRTVNLTTQRPFKNFYLDKFVPKAIRRVMEYTHMGIQINVPTSGDISQDYHSSALTVSKAHVGVKCICNYHEWNSNHYQEMTSIA